MTSTEQCATARPNFDAARPVLAVASRVAGFFASALTSLGLAARRSRPGSSSGNGDGSAAPRDNRRPERAGGEVVLDVRDLSVSFKVHGGEVHAVRNVSFHVRRGETLCVVGESGSGKSVTVQAVMGILPVPPARVRQGEAWLDCGGNPRELLSLSARERRQVLGKEIAMIFQDPLTSLNPTMTIYDQIAETLILHTEMTEVQRRARVLELLELVRIPEPHARLAQYPHELSGGMRQRVMIAMALACDPKVLIADEPTTALDVTIQAQILSLIKSLAAERDMATILITHDLGVVARMADRVAVMYAGKIVEEGTTEEVFYRPKHPYTLGLKRAMPKEDGDASEPLRPIPGTPPDLFRPPVGCAFEPRCPAGMVVCRSRQPGVTSGPAGTRVSCWLHHPGAEVRRTQMEADGLFFGDSAKEGTAP